MPARKLIRWFLQNQRDLPWRKTRDPYSIWISEVMLQQTTSRAVVPYYEKFLKAFPHSEALARAPLEKVLSFWSGLGYYSRAKNLHHAAQQIVERGGFPESHDELLKLKGIGPYTAAAVSSIAFGEAVPVVDGNVIRVITRLFDISKDVSLRETLTQIRTLAQKMMGSEDPASFNQGMMELGATVCIPKSPACLICPLSENCLARKNGAQLLRPVKARKLKQEPWAWRLFISTRKGKIALVKANNGTPWLKSSWVFPGEARKLAKKPLRGWDFKHSITKHDIYVTLEKENLKGLKNLRWTRPQDIADLGVSSVVLKTLRSEKFKQFLKETS